MIDDPNMLIVGNGPSADTRLVAEAMAIGRWAVMRINNFRAGQFITDDCDVWGTSLNSDIVAPKSYVLQTWWSGHPAPAQISPWHIDERPRPGLLHSLFAEFAPFHPSTGVILAHMAERLGYHVTLAGFDHFDAPAHHHWPDATPVESEIAREVRRWHDPARERAALARFPALRNDARQTSPAASIG